jgi:aromatic ring-opening dioxygenase LigB subunit
VNEGTRLNMKVAVTYKKKFKKKEFSSRKHTRRMRYAC